MASVRVLFVGVLALVAMIASGIAPGGSAPPRITLMTWNIYYGGGANGGFADMGDMFESVEATNFPQRAARMAKIIEGQKPHIICLQEVARWQTEDFIGDEQDDIDFLAILQQHLLSRGLQYDIVSTVETIDFEAPGSVDGELLDVRWIERIAMLARRSSNIQIGEVRNKHYVETYSIDLPVVGPLEFKRGWIAADITFRGKKARYVCTHLEAFDGGVRRDQATQLIDWLSGTGLPVVVMGDMNAMPASNVYQQFINAGYADAWTDNHGMFDGPTCCQSGDLIKESNALSRRIDHIWLRGALTPISTARVGQKQEDRTSAGLWPSDHAAVVAKVQLD